MANENTIILNSPDDAQKYCQEIVTNQIDRNTKLEKLVINYDITSVTHSPFYIAEASMGSKIQNINYDIELGSNVTILNGLFYKCTHLRKPPLFDTSNVTSMANMFAHCMNLREIPKYNTSNVTKMNSMFSGCQGSFSMVEIPQFDTSKVKDFSSMFLESDVVKIPKFDMSSSIDTTDFDTGTEFLRENLNKDFEFVVQKSFPYEYSNVDVNDRKIRSIQKLDEAFEYFINNYLPETKFDPTEPQYYLNARYHNNPKEDLDLCIVSEGKVLEGLGLGIFDENFYQRFTSEFKHRINNPQISAEQAQSQSQTQSNEQDQSMQNNQTQENNKDDTIILNSPLDVTKEVADRILNNDLKKLVINYDVYRYDDQGSNPLSELNDDLQKAFKDFIDVDINLSLHSVEDYDDEQLFDFLIVNQGYTVVGDPHYEGFTTVTNSPFVIAENLTHKKIKEINFDVTLDDQVTKLESLYENCSELKTVPNIDTSNVTSMYAHFKGCEHLEKVPRYDTSSVRNMSYMFYGTGNNSNHELETSHSILNKDNPHCSVEELNYVPMFKDTSRVTDISYMFSNSSLRKLPKIELPLTREVYADNFASDCPNLTDTQLTIVDYENLTKFKYPAWAYKKDEFDTHDMFRNTPNLSVFELNKINKACGIEHLRGDFALDMLNLTKFDKFDENNPLIEKINFVENIPYKYSLVEGPRENFFDEDHPDNHIPDYITISEKDEKTFDMFLKNNNLSTREIFYFLKQSVQPLCYESDEQEHSDKRTFDLCRTIDVDDPKLKKFINADKDLDHRDTIMGFINHKEPIATIEANSILYNTMSTTNEYCQLYPLGKDEKIQFGRLTNEYNNITNIPNIEKNNTNTPKIDLGGFMTKQDLEKIIDDRVNKKFNELKNNELKSNELSNNIDNSKKKGLSI